RGGRGGVSPRLGAAADSTAAPGAVARGTLGAGTLASGAAAGGSPQRAARGPTRRSLRRQGRAAEAARAKAYAFSILYEKVFPSKGLPGWPRRRTPPPSGGHPRRARRGAAPPPPPPPWGGGGGTAWP